MRSSNTVDAQFLIMAYVSLVDYCPITKKIIMSNLVHYFTLLLNTELTQHLQLAHKQVHHQLLCHLTMFWIEYLPVSKHVVLLFNTLSSSISHFRDKNLGNSIYVPIPQSPLWISL